MNYFKPGDPDAVHNQESINVNIEDAAESYLEMYAHLKFGKTYQRGKRPS